MAKELAPVVDYDTQGDVLYVFLGEPYPTVNAELDQNITLRFDPTTKALAGLMIHQYSELFPGSLRSEDQRVLGLGLIRLLEQLLREQKFKEPIPA